MWILYTAYHDLFLLFCTVDTYQIQDNVYSLYKSNKTFDGYTSHNSFWICLQSHCIQWYQIILEISNRPDASECNEYIDDVALLKYPFPTHSKYTLLPRIYRSGEVALWSEYIATATERHAINVYTDSSAYQHKVGIGIFFTDLHPDHPTLSFCQSLGRATNSYGELYAIAMALHIFDMLLDVIPHNAILLIHTDSQTNFTDIFTTPDEPAYPELLHYTTTHYFKGPPQKIMFKVPHEDKHGLQTIPGNDTADKYAKFAMRRSNTENMNITLPAVTFGSPLCTNHYRTSVLANHECDWFSYVKAWWITRKEDHTP